MEARMFLHLLSILFILTINITQTFASDEEATRQYEEQQKSKHQAWVKEHKKFTGLNTAALERDINKSMSQLGINERPLPIGQSSYITDGNGTNIVVQYGNATEFSVKAYGTGNGTPVNYVATGTNGHHETFTPAMPQTYKASRKHPFKAFSKTINGINIDFDAGHGIDHADTLIANGWNSSKDPINFVPQNRYYNQTVRNNIVQHMVRKTGGSYKELAIYDDKPIIHQYSKGRGSNKQTYDLQLPIGFIFICFDNHEVSRTFYFPNLIQYEKIGYKATCDKYEINPTGALDVTPVKKGDAAGHAQSVYQHSYMGYRSMSGSFDIADNPHIPKTAKAALMKMLAIYHIEKTAEKEFETVEHKAALVRIFTDRMRYLAFDQTTPTQEKERDKKKKEIFKRYSKYVSEKLREEFDLEEYALQRKLYPTQVDGASTKVDIREQALSKAEAELAKIRAGSDLYLPQRAKSWLQRIENQVKDRGSIEDTIQLLELYDIPKVSNPGNKTYFQKLLEQKGKKRVSLDETRQIANYFHGQGDTAKKELWMKALLERFDTCKNRAELLNASDWYYKGYGCLPNDPNMMNHLQEKAMKL